MSFKHPRLSLSDVLYDALCPVFLYGWGYFFIVTIAQATRVIFITLLKTRYKQGEWFYI